MNEDTENFFREDDDEDCFFDPDFDIYEDQYGQHWGEYRGSYAQDVAGLSDETISDAFEGDPDMYWNID